MVATQACPTGQVSPAATQGYHRRRPSETVLYQAVQAHLETWLAQTCWEDSTGNGVPVYVERDFRKYLECGILAHGFARARCKACGHDFLIAFSCKGRGACPSCNTRRMAEIAGMQEVERRRSQSREQCRSNCRDCSASGGAGYSAGGGTPVGAVPTETPAGFSAL